MSTSSKAILLDFVERAGWTAAQQFFAVLLAVPTAGKVVDLPWQAALVMSAGAAVVSVATTAIQYLTKLTDLGFWADLGVRLVKTFLASFLGFVGANAFNVLEFDWARALDVAVLATLAALAKCILAAHGGDRGPARDVQAIRAEGTHHMVIDPSTLPADTYHLAIRKTPGG